MKNINFKQTHSALRILEDELKAKKKINWDRIIYMSILALIVFFLGKHLYNRFLYITATGHILFENRNVRNVNDCQLLKIYVSEGDSIKAGDTLFSYMEGNQLMDGQQPDLEEDLYNIEGPPTSTDQDNWIAKETYSLKKSISANHVRVRQQEKLYSMFLEQRKRLKEQVILDLSPRAKLDDLEESIKQTEFEIQRLKSEIAEASAFIESLSGLKTEPATNYIESGKADALSSPYAARYYLSPIDGMITKINFQSMEVALKSEIILSIHKPEHIYVKAFFDQSDMQNVKIGDELTVEFPDGSRSTGVIKRFYYATNALPEEFQKKYEPVTRTLLADVIPINNQELLKWHTFYRMGVKIYKYKY